MNDYMDDFEMQIDPEEPVFIISVVSELVGLPVWTLRKLDEMGVVIAQRRGKRTRCYSKKQMTQLAYIRFLLEDKKVNISGIKIILELDESR